MDILVNVVNQKLKIATNLKSLVAGSQNFIRFVFNLTSDWDDLKTFAQFRQGNNSYNQYLDDEKSAYLPSEIGAGTCTLLLYGSGGTKRATTNYLTLTIDENLLVSNASSTDISTSLYDQLVTHIINLESGNSDAVQELIDTDASLQSQINTIVTDALSGNPSARVATYAELDTEHSRAAGQEAALSNQISELRNNLTNLESSETVSGLINSAVVREMQTYLNSGVLAGMTIPDGSITKAKLSSLYLGELDGQFSDISTAMETLQENIETARGEALSDSMALADTVLDLTNKTGGLSDALTSIQYQVSYTPVLIKYKSKISTYYELRNGEYVLTQDADFVSGKTYYKKNFSPSIGAAVVAVDNRLNDAMEDARKLKDYTTSDPNDYTAYNSVGDAIRAVDAKVQSYATQLAELLTNLHAIKIVTTLPASAPEDELYCLKTNNGGYLLYLYLKDSNNNYAWRLLSGSKVNIGNSLPQTGDEYTDYYCKNASGNYVHYRWIVDTASPNGAFKSVGSDSYSKTELDNKFGNYQGYASIADWIGEIQSTVSRLDTDVNGGAGSAGLKEAVDALQNEDDINYSINFDDSNNKLSLYADEEEISSTIITGTGGGGGGQASSNLTVDRITLSPVVATPNDDVWIRFTYESTDKDGVPLSGDYTWRKDGQIILTGQCKTGLNEFNMSEYCSTGTQKFTLTVRDEADNVQVRTWAVQIINISLQSSFDDSLAYAANDPIVFKYKPSGALLKTIYMVLDGKLIAKIENVAASGTEMSYSIPGQSHGAHFLECFMTAKINNLTVESNHIYKDIICYDETETKPVIGCIYRNAYRRIVQNPKDGNLGEYYTFNFDATINSNPYVKAPYKEVTNPMTDDLSKYYELSGSTYSLTSDTAINSNKTYYEKKITEGVTYYSTKTYALQYDTTSIQYYVYDPNTSAPSVERRIGSSVISTHNMTSNTDVWSYKSTTTGNKNLVIACEHKTNGNVDENKSASITVAMSIQGIDIDISPVTAGLRFDFNPTGYSNSGANRLWKDSNNQSITMSVSNNFNWNSGGYQLDENDDTYFCVKAGTSATINYNMFANDLTTNGANFKVIFKAVNVRDPKANFLHCTYPVTALDDDGNEVTFDAGIKMNVHEAYFHTNVYGGELYSPYSEEDKIEFEININAVGDTGAGSNSMILSYEDGVAARPLLYTSSAHLVYNGTLPITIAPTDCDVYIYRMKFYSTSLSDSSILTNFITDASNAEEMISRYNRNQIYDENNNLTPQSVANACPDLKVIMIECPRFTTSKSDFVKYTNVTCIHKNGDPDLDNWTFTNCYHAGQGTTSNEYGYAARNIDILCCLDGQTVYSSKINKGNVEPDYKTTLTLARSGRKFYNGTGKVALSRTSVPNNWFNIKVNVASSENANNALLQKRYNDYLPYTPASQKRAPDNDEGTRKAIVKNDMEFYNCVVFVRETGMSFDENGEPITVARSEYTDSAWHFYSIGNIGDSKKTDNTRANDPTDIKEFAIEISDNSQPNSAFPTGVYAPYTAVANPTAANLGTYYEKNVSIYTKTKDTSIDSNKTYYTRGAITYNKNQGEMVYPITEAQWNNANNLARINLAYSFDGDDTDEYECSFEFRYDMGGQTRDGDTTGVTAADIATQRERNKQIFKDFYKWIVTSSDEDFVDQLNGWFIQESALYWYLFTERYVMIDNRSKNTFWHFGDTGVYREVPSPSDTFMDYYYEKTGENEYTQTTDTAVNANKTYYWSYAFELWCYDTDKVLSV